MLYLKPANEQDILKEYNALTNLPPENGFENKYFGCNFEHFKNACLPEIINYSSGINLPAGYVPCTYYFLWEDDEIVALFKLRHSLTETLKKIGGHVGYSTLPQYRGRGYATKGLALMVEECKKIIKEPEIYMSVNKTNLASLKVQQKNGAKIVGEYNDHYLTRIKIK